MTDSRLGQSGYAARLKGLPGDLDMFNNKLTRPTKLADDRYHVMLKTPGTMKDVELVLPARCFEIVVDLDHRSSHAGGTGLSSVLDALTQQVSSFIHDSGGRTITDVFTRTAGSDGQLDKNELYTCLRELNADVSPQEIELIWPVFDMDKSGHIEYEEFLEFCDAAAQTTPALGMGSGMKAACEALTNKVRMTVNAAASEKGKDVMGVFRMFDLNGDMTIDKEEFRFGCQALKINISAKEVDAVWPMFDKDMSGSIDMDEFIKCCKGLGHRDNTHINKRDNWTDSLTRTNKAARKSRIVRATDAAILLADISLTLRDAVHGFLEDESLTPVQLFQQFDIDGSNSIDRNELYERLHERGFQISPPELNIIWPIINEDDDDTVSLEEWMNFLNKKNKNWSFSKLKDRILARLPENYHELLQGRKVKKEEKVEQNKEEDANVPTKRRPKRPTKAPIFNTIRRPRNKENVSSFGRRVIYKELRTDLADSGYIQSTGTVTLPPKPEGGLPETEAKLRSLEPPLNPGPPPVSAFSLPPAKGRSMQRGGKLHTMNLLPHELAQAKKELWSVPHNQQLKKLAKPRDAVKAKSAKMKKKKKRKKKMRRSRIQVLGPIEDRSENHEHHLREILLGTKEAARIKAYEEEIEAEARRIENLC